MNVHYWDRFAENYKNEVLSVYHRDSKQRITKALRRLTDFSPSETAADMGCGVGYFTPLLADLFERVEACDFSMKSLDFAKEHCRQHSNTHFHQLDLCVDHVPFDPVDLVLCVNVLIMPDFDQRLKAWRAITNQVKEAGILVVVVPSLESIHMQRWDAVEYALDEGQSADEAVNQSFSADSEALNLHQGIHSLDGQPTKHYLKEELKMDFENHHFEVLKTKKVIYPSVDWDVHRREVNWDWMIVGKRKRC